MTTTTATFVTCPMHDGSCGEQVAAHGFGDWTATTVTVEPCTSLLAQGWVGPQLVTRKSQADRLLPQQTVLQHRDGLVTFAV